MSCFSDQRHNWSVGDATVKCRQQGEKKKKGEGKKQHVPRTVVTVTLTEIKVVLKAACDL